jgi:hypothetical protein
MQKHYMELKIRDVYHNLPSDARISSFYRVNNANTSRINRFMNSTMLDER